MRKDTLLEKLVYEHGRVEDLIYDYATKNGFIEFRTKWGNKPYSDEDHTLPHMVSELLDQIKAKQDNT